MNFTLAVQALDSRITPSIDLFLLVQKKAKEQIMGRKPRINSFIYTYGKFGKGFREILDTENKFLYSHGRYPTKIVAEDLPEDYIKI